MEKQSELFNYLCKKSFNRLELPLAFIYKSFDNLENYENVIPVLKSWDYKTPLICSIISPQNGIGKTHLSIALIRQFVENKQIEYLETNYKTYLSKQENEVCSYILTDNIKFISARRILLEIRSNYGTGKSELETIDSYSTPDLLVIDDIFSSKEKGDRDFERRVLLDIIDNRTEYLLKPTILTGNLTLEEIANIDTRLASRINNSMLIQITKKLTDFRKLN